MSLTASSLVALVFGPFVLVAFSLDPVGFLARNGLFAVGYVTAACLGTILYVAVGIRVAGALKGRRSSDRDAGSAPGV